MVLKPLNGKGEHGHRITPERLLITNGKGYHSLAKQGRHDVYQGIKASLINAENKTTGPKWSTEAWPPITKPRLNYSFRLSQEWTPKPVTWSALEG